MMRQPTFDPHGARKYTSEDATAWMEWSGTALADVVNERTRRRRPNSARWASRAPNGSFSDFEFACDEVLVVTTGGCTVRGHGDALTARVGEVLYLPAGVSGTFHADEDVELVYVASSPYGEVNREMKAALLGRTTGQRGSGSGDLGR